MKLMIKIAVIMLGLVGLITFFLRDTLFEERPTAATSTAAAAGELQQVASLPNEVEESSGLIVLPDGNYLTHNDAGNKPHLYQLDAQGKLQATFKLNLPNVDWEDLAKDDEGNIYIADSGNNNNSRRELAVYKVNLAQPEQVQAIRYTYEDQKEYPPKKKDRNFDSEAIFWSDGSLYLISKDRGQGATAKVYQLPDQPGTHQAKVVGSHQLKAEITGAAISPNGKMVALVSESALHLFSDFSSADKFYEGTYEKRQLKNAGQTEALDFMNDEELVITSEGGNLYRYTL
ncbi:hypothetical protein [Pontibacter akesuensis]|uniref:Uncharacterized protein n=1 Tax=Pontibacter akesuensis TaxID=388950 RepID=A0A1I7J4E0_9BACT|nr:hypothetical protein [Pontibacter akesuensis]GHA72500.1 hypothetical protein GCM10007389_27810 [Pontibacter akesuensis]SFU80030.1 hypothetical protein SAMN04487941_2480 [Pontibacter akesuensis]